MLPLLRPRPSESADRVGVLVDASLAGRWCLRRGLSRCALPETVGEAGPIGLCVTALESDKPDVFGARVPP